MKYNENDSYDGWCFLEIETHQGCRQHLFSVYLYYTQNISIHFPLLSSSFSLPVNFFYFLQFCLPQILSCTLIFQNNSFNVKFSL